MSSQSSSLGHLENLAFQRPLLARANWCAPSPNICQIARTAVVQRLTTLCIAARVASPSKAVLQRGTTQ